MSRQTRCLRSCIRPIYASRSAAGLDGIRGSAARQMDELIWLASFHGPLPNPDHTGLPSHSLTLASQH
jgi:hypothetical protein